MQKNFNYPFQTKEKINVMKNEAILDYVFDQTMRQQILDYAAYINQSNADVYIVMARKCACFTSFLQDLNLIIFNGLVITDKRLEYDLEVVRGKKVLIIDDIVVSGTSIYNVIDTVKPVANSVQAIVLGVNTKWFEKEILENEENSYICAPYNNYSDSECMQICSNLVRCFALATIPYDVDFPTFSSIKLSQALFSQIIAFDDWYSFDVSSQIQAENGVKTISLLPTQELINELSAEIGINVGTYAFCKIRLFVRYINKKKETCVVTAVPYFLVNEIADDCVVELYKKFIGIKEETLSSIAKLRVLQFVFSVKLYNRWVEKINKVTGKTINTQFNFSKFNSVFPADMFDAVLNSVKNINICKCLDIKEIEHVDYSNEISKLNIHDSSTIASLQARLVEPFTDLYLNKELEARALVKRFKKQVFQDREYRRKVDRLKSGYSYNFLRQIIEKDCGDNFNVDVIVSLFIDKAIDAGVIVPIIVYDKTRKILYRAYRHGEDVPFGEKEEKLCALMLKDYQSMGGASSISKLRLEKLLVLLLRIGLHLKLFTRFASNTQNEDLLYNTKKLHTPNKSANITSYLFGDVVTIDAVDGNGEAIREHYIRNKNDAVWLSGILEEKGIITLNELKKYSVEDNIYLEVDAQERSCAQSIGQVFGYLYREAEETKKIDDFNDMLTQLSTCLFPRDITSALAAEIAIFSSYWQNKNKKFYELLNSNELDLLTKELKHEKLYSAVNSGQKKYTSFMDRMPLKYISNVTEYLKEKVKTNCLISPILSLWESFWPSSIVWTEESIPQDLLAIITREGVWILLMNCYIRGVLYFIDSGKDSVIYLNEIIDYKNKLKTYTKSEKAIKIVETLLCDLENSIIAENKAKLLKALFERVEDLVGTSLSILQESDLIINRFGQVNKISRYNNALFISPISDSEELFEKTVYDQFNGIDSSELRVVHKNENKLGRGLLIIGTGRKDTRKQLFVLLKSLLQLSEVKINAKLFLNLPDEFQIKAVNECNTNHKYGYFWSYIDMFDVSAQKIEEGVTIYDNLGKKDYGQYVESDILFLKDYFSGNNKYIQNTQSEITKKGYKVSIESFTNRKKFEIDVLVMVATEEEEAAITTNCPKWEFKNSKKYDGYYYKRAAGRSFALVRAANMGSDNATAAAQYFIGNLNPRVLAMVGFCAGRKGKVNLGDVIIAGKTYNYDIGAQTSDVDVLPEIDSFQLNDNLKLRLERFSRDYKGNIAQKPPMDFMYQCVKLLWEMDGSEQEIINLVDLYNPEKYDAWKQVLEWLIEKEFIITDDNKLFALTNEGKAYINEIKIKYPDYLEKPIMPKTRIGVLATGCRVQKWDGVFGKLEKTHDRKTVALDMEGHAMNRVGVINGLVTIVVKGVGDYATNNKSFDNRFMKYACCASYSFIESFLTDETTKHLFN